MKRAQIPAFGNWDYCNELPITQYFESAMQAGVFHGKYFGEDGDLFKFPATAKPTYYHRHHHNNKKVKKSGVQKQQHQIEEEQQRKPRNACNFAEQTPTRKTRVAKPVDEDLYKIPPELLYQKSKMKRLLKSLWSGCLELNCIA
ncbi:uncharacterized protein [Typha latifolia]|uniref:uncharacterized protein n=1 Tax=Typha latifolia TaxID=4733 RepID=UPI003C2F2C1C